MGSAKAGERSESKIMNYPKSESKTFMPMKAKNGVAPLNIVANDVNESSEMEKNWQ